MAQNPTTLISSDLCIGEELDSVIVANLEQINADSIKHTVQQLQDKTTRFMLAPNRKDVALWIQDRFESVGCTNTVIDSFQTHSILSGYNMSFDTITWQYNVIATIPGTMNPDKISLIGGHYDSFSTNDPMNLAPGADDNGSSVAAAIEIARVIVNSEYPPNKTIRFLALGAEELMNYSTVSGARDYAAKCALGEENIQIYINNDMIAHEPSASDWIVDYLVHDMHYWTTPFTSILAEDYTSLTTNVVDQGNFGADDLPFWQAGYQTGYFFEHNFCPYYHSENDVVDNCNFDYCREVTRLNMALLLSVTEIPSVPEKFFLFSAADGQTLTALWEASSEADLESYEVHFGTNPENFQISIMTQDTSWVFPNLDPDSIYYAQIQVINTKGNRSWPLMNQAQPAEVSLDEGILVVAGSQGGLLDPPQEMIDQYYNALCAPFLHSTYDATTADELKLETIGKYSTLFWHHDALDVTSDILSSYSDILRNYLYLGGHIMFTGFKPARNFSGTTYPAAFREGDFVYDCLKIQTSENESARLFSGTLPTNPDWPVLYVDSAKMPVFNFHLPWVEVFTATSDGSVVYRYDTKQDTTAPSGSYFNKPMGIVTSGESKQTVTISAPLYYLDSTRSKQMVYHVMTQLFGEITVDVENQQMAATPGINVFPNPANSTVHFELFGSPQSKAEICVLKITGEEVHRIISDGSKIVNWDIRDFANGIYIYQVIFPTHFETGKIIVRK